VLLLQAGVVTFDGQTEYTSYEQWAADVDKHGVPPGTPYSWQPGSTTVLYGWHIASAHPVQPPTAVPAMRRTYSSWFTVVHSDDEEQQQQQQQQHPATARGAGPAAAGVCEFGVKQLQ
jgi:hypothetical protein